MKCVKNTEEYVILRVSDDEAFKMTENTLEDWKYCPKHEWKKYREQKSS